MPPRLSLDHVFRLEETRTVANDWVVRYANRHFQLARQRPLPPARRMVTVFEDAAGQIEIRYRDRRMRWTEIAAPVPVAPASTGPARPRTPTTQARGSGQRADHPWRDQVIADHVVYRQLVRDRRAWERVQP